MDRWLVCLLLGVVAAVACGGVSPVAAVRARARAAALMEVDAGLEVDDADAQELEDELAADLPPLQATAPAPVFTPGLGADYHAAAAAHDAAYPEPAAPPRPAARHQYHPTAPAAAAAEPTSLVATAASTASAAKAEDKAKAATATAAAAAGAAKAGAGAGTTAALTHYNEFLSRNVGFAQSLTALFKQFDRNGDGFIDLSTELPALVKDNTITAQHANTLAAWDIDGDHRISEKEWMMGPLYVSLLQYNPLRKAEFERLVATGGDTSEISQIFAHIAAGSAEDLPNFVEMKVAARDASGKTEEELALEAEHEQHELQAQAELAADDTARFAARHGRRRRKEKMSNKAARAAELLAQKRPTSRHGIPSEADEHCVLCQYLVQRIQKQLYYTLQNGNDGFPADPNAEVSAKKMRQVNAQLLNRRGGKGLLRILSEDIVSDMCEADQMPELYYSACRKIDKKFPVLLDAIYFQFHSEAVCEEANLCGKKTYFNQPSSVHLPSKSIVYNSGRGKCGLMGGARERANAFISAALCFAGSLFEAAATVAQA